MSYNKAIMTGKLALLLFTTSLYAKYPLLIYYGNTYDVGYFGRYETVILDPDQYRNVEKLGSRSFAYVSLGEVSRCRTYYRTLEEAGLLDGKNAEWGSHHIKISDGRWRDLLLEEVIPPIIEAGYDGLFLDTVDSLIARNESRESIINLVKAIKKRYPKLKLMLNRGFEIADLVPIDALLYESTISHYNYKTEKYSFFSYDFRFYPKRKIERFSVDYWDPAEPKKMAEIYRMALKNGYKPLVTTITLTEMPKVRCDISKNVIEYY